MAETFIALLTKVLHTTAQNVKPIAPRKTKKKKKELIIMIHNNFQYILDIDIISVTKCLNQKRTRT